MDRDKEMKRFRANSAFNQKEFYEYDKENAYDYNVLSEETSSRNRIDGKKSLSNHYHHHLLNQNYKNQSNKSMEVNSPSSQVAFTGNQLKDLYDKLKSDYTQLMINFQKEQMECNNIKSQSKLEQKKLIEQDKIIAEQQQEIVTLNNEIQLQTSQNQVLRQYLKEQEDRVTKVTAENSNLNFEISSNRPNSLKNKNFQTTSTITQQQNEIKIDQLIESKDCLERQIEQIQQQNYKLQIINKELCEEVDHVKMQFCTLENHTQQIQRNAKQLELEISQSKINESLLQKSYSKLEEDYNEMQNMNINLQDHNKQLQILISKLEDKIKLMEDQCNSTIYWEQTAKELEYKQQRMIEDQSKKQGNLKEMETYIQSIKKGFNEERERLFNELKSQKKEIQLYKEKNESYYSNMQSIQKEYSILKSQIKTYQNQSELVKNLKDTMINIESSLSKEIKLNDDKSAHIKNLEIQLDSLKIQIDEIKASSNEKDNIIIKLEQQNLELINKKQPSKDLSCQEQQINSTNRITDLNETQQNYNSYNNKSSQQLESQYEMQEKIKRLEQTIQDLQNQYSQQNNNNNNMNQDYNNNSYQQPQQSNYHIPKNISINNSPLHKNNYVQQQHSSNNYNNHNIHSYHNSSFNMSRPTIELDRNQSQNNSFHYRKNSNDGSSFLGSIMSGFYTNKNKTSSAQMENLQRKYEEIKNRAIKNNQ